MKEKLEDLVPLLKEKELKIVFWDCYRPISVQKKMWEIVPDARFVADPRKGSQHNRGIAVDITLADQSGLTMEMPTEFDDFSPKASPQYQCTETEKKKCQNRDLLIKIMGTVGLSPLNSEWWHYQLKSAGYPVIPELHE